MLQADFELDLGKNKIHGKKLPLFGKRKRMDWGKQNVREATAKKSLYANRTRTAFHKPLSGGAGL